MRRTTQATYKTKNYLSWHPITYEKKLTMQLPNNNFDNQSITFFEA